MQPRRDLLVGNILEVVEREHDSLMVRQLPECLVDHGAPVLVAQVREQRIGKRREPVRRAVAAVAVVVCARVPSQVREQPPAFAVPGQVIERQIGRDGPQRDSPADGRSSHRL